MTDAAGAPKSKSYSWAVSGFSSGGRCSGVGGEQEGGMAGPGGTMDPPSQQPNPEALQSTPGKSPRYYNKWSTPLRYCTPFRTQHLWGQPLRGRQPQGCLSLRTSSELGWERVYGTLSAFPPWKRVFERPAREVMVLNQPSYEKLWCSAWPASLPPSVPIPPSKKSPHCTVDRLLCGWLSPSFTCLPLAFPGVPLSPKNAYRIFLKVCKLPSCWPCFESFPATQVNPQLDTDQPRFYLKNNVKKFFLNKSKSTCCS